MQLNDINAGARYHRQDLIAEAARERTAREAREAREARRARASGRSSRTVRVAAALAGVLASALGAVEHRLSHFAGTHRQGA